MAQSGLSAAPIVDAGKPKAQTVIAENALRTQRLAARELQRYVEKISGAKLPIGTTLSGEYAVAIYVGRSAYTEKLGIDDADLKYGAYRMVSGDSWLALVGRDSEYTPKEPWPRSRPESASEEFLQVWDEVYRWDSQAEVTTHVDKDYWSVEIVIPVVEDTSDPLHEVMGRRKPPRSLPWYFNLCRRRVGEDAVELSAFSPTGEQNGLVPAKFALLYDHPRR